MEKRDFKNPEHVKWRKAVFKRDGFRCMHPGCEKKTGLNPHHIKTFARYPLLRTVVSNGITLCREHHRQTFGREEDFEQLYTSIVLKKTNKNPDILRFKYTGKMK